MISPVTPKPPVSDAVTPASTVTVPDPVMALVSVKVPSIVSCEVALVRLIGLEKLPSATRVPASMMPPVRLAPPFRVAWPAGWMAKVPVPVSE